MSEVRKKKNGLNITIVGLFAMLLILIGYMWTMGSVLAYLIIELGDVRGYFIFVVFGIFGSMLFIVWAVGTMAIRSTKRWKDEKCRNVMLNGFIDTRLFKKSEALIAWSIFLGICVGVGAWDLSLTITALIANSWDFSVMFDDYLFLDLVYVQIYSPLWVFALTGTVELIIPTILAFRTGNKIKKGNFCELKQEK